MERSIFLILMVMVIPVSGNPLFDMTAVALSASTSSMYMSHDAEYVGQDFDMDLNVDFSPYISGITTVAMAADGWYESMVDIVLRLGMPGSGGSYQNCQTDITLPSGETVTEDCTTELYFSPKAELTGSVYVTMGDGFSTSSIGSLTPDTSALYTEGYIDIHLEEVTILPDYASSNYYITAAYSNMVIHDDDDATHEFNATVLVYALNATGARDFYDAKSSNLTIYNVGPALGGSITFNTTNDIQAGDCVEITVTVDHGVNSNQDAASLMITLEVDDFLVQAESAMWNVTNLGSYASFSSLPETISIGAFPLTSTFTTTFNVCATDSLSLNSYANVYVELSFVSDNDSSIAYNYVIEDRVATASPNLSDNALDMMFPSSIATGDTVIITKYFTMPYGTLYMGFYAEMTSDTQSTIPLTVSSTATTKPSYVAISSKRKRRDVGASTGLQHRNRRAANTDSLSQSFDTLVNPSSSGQPNAPVTVTAQLDVGAFDAGATQFNMQVGSYFGISPNVITSPWQYISVSLINPQLTVNKTVYMVDAATLPNVVRFEVTVQHADISNYTAYDVSLSGGDSLWSIDWSTVTTDPSVHVSSFSINSDDTQWTWSRSSLALANSLSVTYESTPKDLGENLPLGDSYHYSTVSFHPSTSSSNAIEVQTSVCIRKDPVYVDDIFYNYGFTALTFVFAFILGVIIVLIILFICIKLCHRVPFMSKDGGSGGSRISDARVVAASGNSGIVMTKVQVKQMANISQRTGFDAVKRIADTDVSDSIVKILATKDQNKAGQELDSLDIINSTIIDDNIEEERNAAIITATCTLLKNMENNGDLNSNTVKNCSNKLRRAATDLDKKLDADYKKDVSDIYDQLSKNNKSKMTTLLEKQEQRRQEMEEKLKNATPEMKAELMEGLRQDQEAEKDNLNNLLKLEQTEKLEELRKEYSVRKRVGLEEVQQNALADAKTEANLSAEQADWMMQEHIKQQVGVKRIYGDELARQRMILNEKLERRRLLAQKQEIQHEYDEQLIQTAQKQEEDAIRKMKKSGTLDDATANIMIAEAKASMKATQDKLDKEKDKQVENLQKTLSERKRKRLEEQAKKQKAELDALEKKQQEVQTSESYVDALALIEEKQNLVSNQRTEMTSLENEIDSEQAAELEKLYEESTEKTKAEVEREKQSVLKSLESKGVDEDQLNKLMSKHEKEVEKLETERERQKADQDANFKATLEKRRREWAAKKERESKEAEALREQEEEIVRKLIDNQVSMGEEERDKIMREHEKAQVKMESNLALSRIQQRRKLEEKMAQKRAQKMEEMQKAQQVEAKKQAKKNDDDSDLDEDEKQQREFELMKRQQEERRNVIKADNNKLVNEMEEVEEELMKERDLALKEQEMRLAAMLADLQMAKAKEMSRIEEQQKAIHNLKSNIMDDLNEKGILSDPECQKVIEIHQQEQEKLAEKLEAQRAKQEKTLRKRMAARMKQKEGNLSQMHEHQLEQAGGKSALTPAAKIRRMALLSKHQQEMTKFRNRIEKEITQAIAELRRKNDVRRIKYLQDQEMQFINGLVRLGKFKLSELESVVQMLFPNRPEDERKKLIDELCEGYKPKPGNEEHDDPTDNEEHDDPTDKNLRVSSLVERVKWTRLAFPSMNQGSSVAGGRRGRVKQKGRKPSYDEPENYSRRPEPLGRSVSPDYNSDRESGRRPPPTRLAPIGPIKKKKKKKKQQLIDEEDAF